MTIWTEATATKMMMMTRQLLESSSSVGDSSSSFIDSSSSFIDSRSGSSSSHKKERRELEIPEMTTSFFGQQSPCEGCVEPAAATFVYMMSTTSQPASLRNHSHCLSPKIRRLTFLNCMKFGLRNCWSNVRSVRLPCEGKEDGWGRAHQSALLFSVCLSVCLPECPCLSVCPPWNVITHTSCA